MLTLRVKSRAIADPAILKFTEPTELFLPCTESSGGISLSQLILLISIGAASENFSV
jgi:hypothetical protein